MSNFEIVLLVMAIAAPALALVFVLPKFKKREKKVQVQTKTYEQIKKEEAKVEEKSEPVQEKKASVITNNDFTSEDFRGYLNHKQKNITRPTRVNLPKDFKDVTEPYIPRRRRSVKEKPKTVAEEIRSLSPELKALIIAGVLDKKDFN